MKKCVVCGRRLNTGRKYCHVHRGSRNESHYREESDNIHFEFLKVLFICAFFGVALYMFSTGRNGLSVLFAILGVIFLILLIMREIKLSKARE